MRQARRCPVRLRRKHDSFAYEVPVSSCNRWIYAKPRRYKASRRTRDARLYGEVSILNWRRTLKQTDNVEVETTCRRSCLAIVLSMPHSADRRRAELPVAALQALDETMQRCRRAPRRSARSGAAGCALARQGRARVLSRAVLPAHCGDHPRNQLGGREQPSDLPEHQSLHLAGADRAHRAGVVAPAARPEVEVVAVQPPALARISCGQRRMQRW